MKKRILSLVLCAVMLLSMCLFMGAGVTADTADTVDTTETADAAETANIVSFTNAGPLVKPEQTAGPARVRALAANDTGSGVQLDKTVTGPDGDGNYTVRLEAYATGAQTTVVSTKPCDIVLVLDVSGSMDERMSQYDRTKKLTALKNAVNNFIDQVAAKETDGVTHRISIVKFAGETTDKVGNDTYDVTTGIWPFEETNTYNYSQIVKGLTDAKSGQAKLKEAVNALKAAGATSADYGMEHAQTVLAGARSDATKVVVMFTDGEPNHYSDFDQDVADAAISAAKSLKADGATVYTVGCMDGANGTPVTNINKVSKVNKYMHLVSSNYKNATKMDDPGAATYPENKNESYYLTANTAAELENAFESINKQTGGSSTKLTSTAVLQDAVTPYFEIPGGTNAEVTLKTANCNGADDNGKLTFDAETAAPDNVKATVKDNTVSVTGFDYSANWCGPRTDAAGSTTYSGQKLIVEFKIQPTDTFLGGNGVQTNVGTDDGIYAPGETTPVEKFQPQQVDVTVKAVKPEATGTEIYLGEKTDLKDRITTDIPQLDGTNNAYVDVTYTVKDENGTVVGMYTVPAGSSEGAWAWMNGSEVQPDKTTTYTVTSTSTPENLDGTQKAVSSNPVEFKITVKTCSLTITKTVKGEGANPNQTFVFNVMKGNDLVATVVLKAGQSTTITGLSVGDYTVVEDTNWSWSYKAEGDGTAKVTLDNDHGYDREAQITNTAKENHWLTSIVDVINKWTTKDGKTTIDNSGHVPAAKTN